MSKARDIADVGAVVGRKNLIINGGFKVSQRGDYATSPVTVTEGVYSVDRFAAWNNSVSQTLQRSSATINGVTKNTLKVTATSSATGYMGIYQDVETQNFQVGSQLTISAYVRSNNPYVRFRTNNVGGVSTNSPTFTNNGTWEKVSWTVETTGTTTTAVRFGILAFDSSTVPITSGDYIEVADIQLELGSVATDFEHRSYGEELALCQRYYEKIGNGTDAILGVTDNAVSNLGYSWPTKAATYSYGVPKRIAPSITLLSYSGSNNIRVMSQASHLTIAENNSSSYSYINTFEADAEL